jgi:hypothetical protein
MTRIIEEKQTFFLKGRESPALVRLFLGFLQEKRLPHVVVRRTILDSHSDLRPNDKMFYGLGYGNIP